MNREIKLRAWDGEDMLNIDHWTLSMINQHLPENHIIMQETGFGLKAQNLWQDDICKAEYCCPVCFQNEPHELIGTIVQAENGLWMFEYSHGEIPLDCEDLTIVKILGNIHQHSKMLKVKK